jgi:hypothetical protein
MVKKRNGRAASESAEGVSENRATPKAPEGYQKQSTDIVGFWDPAKSESLHFVPLEVKLFDSKIEPHKPSAIVVGKLVDAITLLAPGGEDEVIEGKQGDIIGVWYKPGMSALKNLGGVKVFMYPNGEIDTGKPNAMKVFEVLSKTKGLPLHVTQDARKKSKHVETSFSGPKGDAKNNAQNPPDQGDDDVPF